MTNLDKVHFLYHFTRIPMYRAHEGNFVLNVAPHSFTIRRNARNKFCEIRYSKKLFSPFFRPVILSSPSTIQVSPNLNVRLVEVEPPPIDFRDAGTFSEAAVPTSDVSGQRYRGDASTEDFLIPRVNAAYQLTISDVTESPKPTCMNKDMRVAPKINDDLKDDDDNKAAIADFETSTRMEAETRRSMCSTVMSGVSTCRRGDAYPRTMTQVQMQPISSSRGETFSGTERSLADVIRTTADFLSAPIDIAGRELLDEPAVERGATATPMEYESEDGGWTAINVRALLNDMKRHRDELRLLNIDARAFDEENILGLVDKHIKDYNLNKDTTPNDFWNHLQDLWNRELTRRGEQRPRAESLTASVTSSGEGEETTASALTGGSPVPIEPTVDWTSEDFERAANWFASNAKDVYLIDFDIERSSDEYIKEYVRKFSILTKHREMNVDQFIGMAAEALERRKKL